MTLPDEFYHPGPTFAGDSEPRRLPRGCHVPLPSTGTSVGSMCWQKSPLTWSWSRGGWRSAAGLAA